MKRVIAASLVATIILSLFLSLTTAADSSILNEEELAYIKENPVVITGVDPSFSPYEFIDKDGIYKGIAADYIKLIEFYTGLTFEVQKDLTWSETYDMALAGEIDVLPMIGITPQRQDLFLFSTPFLNYQRVLISTSESEQHRFNDIDSYQVGVQRNSSHYSYLVSETEADIVGFETLELLLEGLSKGEVQVGIANHAASRYEINKLGFTNLKIDEVYSKDKTELAMAITKDNVMLQNIVNKAIDAITAEEQITIQNKWLGTVETAVDYTAIWNNILIAAGIVFVILSTVIYWSYTLKKEIRRRALLEAELSEAKQTADQANAAKSLFLAHMSHEIRTPMNAISGATYLLENTETSDVQNRYIKTIKSASHNLLNVITDILDFSKIEAGEMTIETISFNLDELLERISRILMPKINDKHLEFHIHRGTDVPTKLIGDPTRLEQCLINLTNNAIKFTEEGDINVIIEAISHKNEQVNLRFIVKDTGIGIDEEKKQYLFKPFHQLDGSITRKYGGTGLGLSITKNLINTLGGEIHVESVVGMGTSFIFNLPYEVIVEDDTEDKKAIIARCRNIKALIADDDSADLKTIRNYLSSFGIDCHEIYRYDNILDHFEPHYNLLILPYMMDGKETIELAAIAREKGMEVILLTKNVNESLMSEADAAGISHVILKPVISSLLFDSIVQCFSDEMINSSQSSIESANQTSKPYKSLTVLLVEDNEINQIIAKEILESKGFKVMLANNGLEAVELMKDPSTYEVHLILMDIHMPVMDGYEATRQIRAEGVKVPILAMTAVSYSQIKDTSVEAGMDGYVTKPVEPDKMFKTIDVFISEHLQKSVEIYGDAPKSIVDEPDIPYVDTKQGIQRLNQNEKLYYKVLKKYFEDMKNIGDEVTHLIRNQRMEEAAELVHKIKGSTGSIGGVRLFQSASILLEALRSEVDDITGPYPYLKDYESDLANTMSQIEAILMAEGYGREAKEQSNSADSLNLEDKRRELLTLLNASDLDAFNVLEEIEAKIGEGDPTYRLVRQCMDQYDFDGAKSALV